MNGRTLAADPELPVLEALAAEPSLSQRELALRVGMSLTKAHFVLRRLVEKGLVKVQNVASSDHKLGYLYLLTPRGIELKARLAYAFMHRTAAQYLEMTTRVENALSRQVPPLAERLRRPVQVAILGKGPLSEVVAHCLRSRTDATLVPDGSDADAAVLVEPSHPVTAHGGLVVMHLG
ncbi:MAG: MarR family EPS-associated transcriptional regulator [Deltaproteobacteria bacterium]|nr:MarR family EPS-associated transcriptional regulator [Deltaproteobacteria bacterium]